MTAGGAVDPGLSDAMAEFALMSELPQMTPEALDVLEEERAARYIAIAEWRIFSRAKQAERDRLAAQFAGMK